MTLNAGSVHCITLVNWKCDTENHRTQTQPPQPETHKPQSRYSHAILPPSPPHAIVLHNFACIIVAK